MCRNGQKVEGHYYSFEEFVACVSFLFGVKSAVSECCGLENLDSSFLKIITQLFSWFSHCFPTAVPLRLRPS